MRNWRSRRRRGSVEQRRREGRRDDEVAWLDDDTEDAEDADEYAGTSCMIQYKAINSDRTMPLDRVEDAARANTAAAA